MSLFLIDGVEYPNIICTELVRKFEVLDGSAAGRLQTTGVMERDIIGTFYNYTMTLRPRTDSLSEMDSLWDVLTAPVDSHTVVVPYNQQTLTFEAYVTNGEQELRKQRNGVNYWGNVQINFIAMAPQRTAG